MEQQKLEQIIKEGKWNSQSDANQYLQKHGLSSQLRDNGVTDIFDTQNTRIASFKYDTASKQVQDIQF
jgi:hypothetical protein